MISLNHCQINDILIRFWQIELVSSSSRLTVQEDFCLNLFRETTTRDVDGRYIVKLPFREAIGLRLGQTKFIAERALDRLKHPFQRNRPLKNLYFKFMQTYQQIGHITEITPFQTKILFYYNLVEYKLV